MTKKLKAMVIVAFYYLMATLMYASLLIPWAVFMLLIILYNRSFTKIVSPNQMIKYLIEGL